MDKKSENVGQLLALKNREREREKKKKIKRRKKETAADLFRRLSICLNSTVCRQETKL